MSDFDAASTAKDRSTSASCPRRETLLDFLNDRLPENEVENVVQHVEYCAKCQRSLDVLGEKTGIYNRLPSIEGFRIEAELGRGGMGSVYLAQRVEDDQVVAIKVLPEEYLNDQERRQRFSREIETLSRLSHPNIVQVFQAGFSQQQPYFVMEYLSGLTLGQFTRSLPIAPKLATEIIRLVANAVQFAHEHQVVHRDLKPSNIILTPCSTGTIRVGGGDVPERCYDIRLLDFSLAKEVDQTTLLTRTGEILGTLGYMAPEQVLGGEVGPSADIYACGILLYELLSGRTPHQAANLPELINQIRHAEPISLRALVPTIPKDLETICEKCLEKEPGKRYATAAELAADLEAFGRSQKITARPVSAIRKLVRWAYRRPATTTAIISATVLLLSGLATTGWMLRQSHLANLALREEQNRTLVESSKVNALNENLTQTQTQLTTGFNDLLEKILKTPELQVASAKPVRVALMQMIPSWLVDLDQQANLDEKMLEQAAFILLQRANDWKEVFGSLDEQVSLLEPAVEYSDYLLEKNPQSAATVSLNYLAKNNLANAYRNLNKLDEAHAYYQDIMALQRRLIEQYSAESQYQADLARSHTNRANVYLRQGRIAEAVNDGNQALTILRRLVQDELHQVNYSLQLSAALNEMGGFYGNGEDFPAAEKVLLEAIEVASGIESVDQEIIERREKTMLDSRDSLSVLYMQTRRFSEAAALNEEIEKYWRGLIQKGNSSAKLDLAYSLLVKMDITTNQQQVDKTRTVAAELELLLNECAAQDPSNLLYDYMLTKSILATAQLDLIEDNGDSLRKHLVLAVQQIIPWFLRHPDNGLSREILFQMVPIFLSAMSLEDDLQREHVKQLVSDTPFAAKFADGPPERIILYRALMLAALGLDEDAEQILETVSMESTDRGRAAVLIAWLTAERILKSEPEKGGQELLRLLERLESLPAEEQALLQRIFDTVARR